MSLCFFYVIICLVYFPSTKTNLTLLGACLKNKDHRLLLMVIINYIIDHYIRNLPFGSGDIPHVGSYQKRNM